VFGQHVKATFESVYTQYHKSGVVDKHLLAILANQDVDAHTFVQWTSGKQFQKYIALVDGKIRFDELPITPHGELIYFFNLRL
jgi:hypothetical protein